MILFMKLVDTSVPWYLPKMLIEIIANKIFSNMIQVSRSVCCRLKSNEGSYLGIISPSLHPLPFLTGKEAEQEAEEDTEDVQIAQ